MGMLRVSYWTGAVVDALAAILLLLPSTTSVWVFHGMRAEGPAMLTSLMAAVLMLGFSAVLLWADRDPMHRRGVLGCTFLVVGGLLIANLAAGFAGAVPWPQLAAPAVVQVALLALFASALGSAERHARHGRRLFAPR